jgi:hypothetical protein
MSMLTRSGFGPTRTSNAIHYFGCDLDNRYPQGGQTILKFECDKSLIVQDERSSLGRLMLRAGLRRRWAIFHSGISYGCLPVSNPWSTAPPTQTMVLILRAIESLRRLDLAFRNVPSMFPCRMKIDGFRISVVDTRRCGDAPRLARIRGGAAGRWPMVDGRSEPTRRAGVS